MTDRDVIVETVGTWVWKNLTIWNVPYSWWCSIEASQGCQYANWLVHKKYCKWQTSVVSCYLFSLHFSAYMVYYRFCITCFLLISHDNTHLTLFRWMELVLLLFEYKRNSFISHCFPCGDFRAFALYATTFCSC